jgi:hypothetical protein
VEAYQRGTESATIVCAVQDGAEWLQGLVDVCDRTRCVSSTFRMRLSI